MDLQVISSNATREKILQILSAADVRLQVRELRNTEDPLIEDYIVAAYHTLAGYDGWLNRCALLSETYLWTAEAWGSGPIELPMRPIVRSVPITMAFVDADGLSTPVAGSWYPLRRNGFIALHRSDTYRWPHHERNVTGRYQLTFAAGFGDTAASIPPTLRQAMRMLAAHWFRNRETVGSEGRAPGKEIEYGLKKLCAQYRLAKDHS